MPQVQWLHHEITSRLIDKMIKRKIIQQHLGHVWALNMTGGLCKEAQAAMLRTTDLIFKLFICSFHELVFRFFV